MIRAQGGVLDVKFRVSSRSFISRSLVVTVLLLLSGDEANQESDGSNCAIPDRLGNGMEG